MSDISALRAEIKAWERTFKQEHRREPSVQEIKDRPDIAAKYKQYKSLSKASSADPTTAHASTSSSRNSTLTAALPRPKTRPVATDSPSITTNPFSPKKNKQGVRYSSANPFATPTKPKHAARELSPDPFPPIEPMDLFQPLAALPIQQDSLSAQKSSKSVNVPKTPTPVTRARKRLRGEPVSPSPVKEKRQRIVSHAASLFGSRAVLDSDDEGKDPDNDLFLGATPMKAPQGGKNFKVLFDEMTPQKPRASNKTNGLPKNSSEGKRRNSRAFSPEFDDIDDDDGELTRGPKLKGLSIPASASAATVTQAHRAHATRNPYHSGLLPAKNDLSTVDGPPKRVIFADSSIQGLDIQGPSTHPVSKKRALSQDAHKDQQGDDELSAGVTRLPLLPPSPPPAESKARNYRAGEYSKSSGKAKATNFTRKKAKLLDAAGGGEEDDDSSLHADETICVKDVTRPRFVPPQGNSGHGESDSEPELSLHPRDQDETFHVAEEPGQCEVDLPEEMQRVLALSPVHAAEDEKHVVSKLLYGRRERNYDASTGGLIWDVGEDGDVGGDEDWEGEPVPWEVGEL